MLSSIPRIGGTQVLFNSFTNGLNNLISTIIFIDLGYSSIPFTWYNNKKGLGKILTRIDHAFTTSEWVNMHGKTFVTHLPMGVSNHASIIISIRSSFTKPSNMFKFQPYWANYKDTSLIVNSCKSHPDFQFNSDPNFTEHFSLLRNELS